MNRHDQELLDKQLRAIHPSPRHDGVLMLTVVAVFFAGMTVGGFLFGSDEFTQVAANEPAISLSSPTLPVSR